MFRRSAIFCVNGRSRGLTLSFSRDWDHDGVVEGGSSQRVAPPVLYAQTAEGGHVGYQVFGEGGFSVVIFSEWAASIETVWEHPVHLRIQQYWASFSRCLFFDPRGVEPGLHSITGDACHPVRDRELAARKI